MRQTKHTKMKNNQDGVTLILSIVLLAAVTFISFSISSIIIREIVVGRLTLRSEPAISAANSGGEVGLYRLFREVGGTSLTGSLSQTGVNFQVTADLYDDSYPFSVPAVAGSDTRVLLYDAENTNNQLANYGKVTITPDFLSGIASYEVFSWSNVTVPTCLGFLTSGGPTICNLNHPTDDRYIVIIKWESGSSISGTLTALDDFDTPRGVPSDSPKLDVKGTNGPVQRRIEINL